VASSSPIPGTLAAHAPTRRARRRVIIRASIQVLVSSCGLLALYFLAPMDRNDDVNPVLLLGGALVIIAVVSALQVWSIIRSPLPAIRALEALAASIPLLILSFATCYFLLSQDDPTGFSEPLSRVGAFYFSMTVFSTVGFGDITPVTDTTRLVVSTQMFVDLVILGVGLRVIFGAIQIGRQRRAPKDDGAGAVDAAPAGDA
jgi:hypothetical protein